MKYFYKLGLMVILLMTGLFANGEQPEPIDYWYFASSNYTVLSMGPLVVNLYFHGDNYKEFEDEYELTSSGERKLKRLVFLHDSLILNESEYLLLLDDNIQIRSIKDHSVIRTIAAAYPAYLIPINKQSNFYFTTQNKFYFYDYTKNSTREIKIFEKIVKDKYYEIFKPRKHRIPEVDKMLQETYLKNKDFDPERRIAYSKKLDTIYFSNRYDIYSWKLGAETMDRVCTGNLPQMFVDNGKEYLYFLENDILKRMALEAPAASEEVINYGVILRYKVITADTIFITIESAPNFKGRKDPLLYIFDKGRIKRIKYNDGIIGKMMDVAEIKN